MASTASAGGPSTNAEQSGVTSGLGLLIRQPMGFGSASTDTIPPVVTQVQTPSTPADANPDALPHADEQRIHIEQPSLHDLLTAATRAGIITPMGQDIPISSTGKSSIVPRPPDSSVVLDGTTFVHMEPMETQASSSGGRKGKAKEKTRSTSRGRGRGSRKSKRDRVQIPVLSESEASTSFIPAHSAVSSTASAGHMMTFRLNTDMSQNTSTFVLNRHPMISQPHATRQSNSTYFRNEYDRQTQSTGPRERGSASIRQAHMGPMQSSEDINEMVDISMDGEPSVDTTMAAIDPSQAITPPMFNAPSFTPFHPGGYLEIHQLPATDGRDAQPHIPRELISFTNQSLSEDAEIIVPPVLVPAIPPTLVPTPNMRVLRILTLLIEDLRGEEPIDMLVELRVPLKQSDIADDEGFWADASEVAEELQESPSRIEGSEIRKINIDH